MCCRLVCYASYNEYKLNCLQLQITNGAISINYFVCAKLARNNDDREKI